MFVALEWYVECVLLLYIYRYVESVLLFLNVCGVNVCGVRMRFLIFECLWR